MLKLLWNAFVLQGRPLLGFPKGLQRGARVAYNLADGDQENYPQLLAPQWGSTITLPERGKNCKRGLSETYLSNWIKQHHIANFYDGVALRVPGHRYEPDLAYIDMARGIFIDIEVDEPYTFARRLPTHIKGHDDPRNRQITDAGWVVLRFSEEQVLTMPERVVRSVLDVVQRIAPDVAMPACVQDAEPARSEPRWNYEEARRRANTRSSEAYQRSNILYRLMRIVCP
ncbi:MAG: DUF559 domain-containing protein [Muribaculaceae bacterium]|nr:DUF559 domain-containing protein [Muribaculaceae bacterium]